MPFLGSIIPSNAVGLTAARRAEDRKKAELRERAEKVATTGGEREADSADLSALGPAQAVEPTAKAHENASEEGHEERVSSRGTPGYGPRGKAQPDSNAGSLDIRG